MSNPIEELRKVWTPNLELEEISLDLAPQTELDSVVRDYLHRICEQKGPQTLILEVGGIPRLNTGNLRWEIVHFAPAKSRPGHREITIWVEGADNEG